jgi:ribosomal protein S6--L-glutamate ligase
VLCEARVSDRRRVTSSNGQAAVRVFIRTGLSLGGLPPREVEISLAARHGMAFPLLVGREALAAWGVLVDPGG